MKLLLTKGWTGDQKLISDNPTEEVITELFNSLDWNDFNSVQLQQDSKNWIDVSGNLSSDGLAIVYEENGNQFVSEEAPKSIVQLEETLTLYLKGDNQFKSFGFSSEDSSVKSTDYDSWRAQHKAKREINQRNHRIAILVAILLVGLFGSILYLWYTDELKFVGHDTDYTTATVIQTKWKAIRGGYVQIVTYEFNFSDSIYNGYFKGTQFTGKHEVGDLVKVKFATDDPKISKRVATFKQNTKHNTMYERMRESAVLIGSCVGSFFCV